MSTRRDQIEEAAESLSKNWIIGSDHIKANLIAMAEWADANPVKRSTQEVAKDLLDSLNIGLDEFNKPYIEMLKVAEEALKRLCDDTSIESDECACPEIARDALDKLKAMRESND